jgi:3-oxoacyl-[acyl-carrier protein] reductase
MEGMTMKRLEGKVAIVTGASSGIGKAIALTFGREGAHTVVAARRKKLCEQVAARIRKNGSEAIAVQTDVTDEAQVARLIASAVQRFGRVDILVNNAGIVSSSRIAETRTDKFDQVMNTNVRGTFFCCREGFKHMQRQGGGTIINMSSVAGTDAWAGTGIYSASKYAIMALTKALADEGRACGIKASALCHAAVADDLVDASPEDIARSERISPYDIAEATVYLATLGPHAVVHQLIVDRAGADW